MDNNITNRKKKENIIKTFKKNIYLNNNKIILFQDFLIWGYTLFFWTLLWKMIGICVCVDPYPKIIYYYSFLLLIWSGY